VNTLGGYLSANKLSKRLRKHLQPMTKFRQFCDAKDETASGKKKGETWTWDVVMNVATAGGTLVETNTMPETNFKILQATGTVTEAGNSVPFTAKLESLAEFAIRAPVETALRNDAAKALDTLAHTQFNLAPIRYVGTSTTAGSFTTNGTATATNTSTLNKYHIGRIKDEMAERSIPAFSGNEYVCVAHDTTLRALKTDLQAVQQYVTEGYTKIMKGEIGTYEGIRFVAQTNISKYTTFGASANTNWAYFFGADTVAEGLVIPEEVRGKIPGDYGRSKGVAWYYLGGFAITHNWGTSDTNAANARIVKWDCATAA
jgi:N4-gp56 family major capsid protein